MERRDFLKAAGLAPLATVKPKDDYEQATENGWMFIFWGWRDRPDATFISAFWTAHKDGVDCVSVVRDERATYPDPYVQRYYRGDVFYTPNSLYGENARERGAKNLSQEELNRVFAKEKLVALNRLREYVRGEIPKEGTF